MPLRSSNSRARPRSDEDVGLQWFLEARQPAWNAAFGATFRKGCEVVMQRLISLTNPAFGYHVLAVGEAAVLERTLSVFIIIGLALLIVGTIFVHSPFALFLAIPAIAYPVFFLGDLYFWMRTFGTNLDQNAPLKNAVQPFVPPLLGEGKIAQFSTVATWEVGLWMSIAASILIIIGLYFHRRAYKPLVVGEAGSAKAA